MTTAVITAERAAETTNATDADQYPEVRSGACRSHPTWPWIVLDADGGVYDRKLGRYRKQSTGGHGYQVVSVAGQDRLVHRLLMEAWYGLDVWDDHGDITRHRDGSKRNHLFNLRPGTHRDNMHDLMRHRGNESSEHCGRGHVKVGANVSQAHAKQGQRACRSCQCATTKANNWKKRKGVEVSEEQVKLWADEKYAKLTAETLGTLAFAVTATATAPHLMATA